MAEARAPVQQIPSPNAAVELANVREELERLRESARMYRASAEISGRLVWSTDADGKVLFISPIFKAVTGVGDEEALKRGWIDWVHPDDQPMVRERWAHSLRTGEPFLAQFQGCLPDGSTRITLSRAVAVRDKEGGIRRWYGSVEDVHEERLAELARRDAEERYRLAVQATNDAVWDYDIVNGTVNWSDNSTAIFGAPAPLGRTPIAWWEERLHPDDRRRVERTWRTAIKRNQPRWSEAYRFRRDDGTYADILDRGFIIRDGSGAAVRAVGAMADLTERHRAEAEIRRMQAELIHVSRVSAMGAMASALAHELNQPLAAVANFLSGARRLAAAGDAAANPDLIAALDAAASGAQRAGEILRRLRELVSSGTVSTDVEHLPTLIEEAGVLAFVDEKMRRISHSTAVEPGAEWVRADRIQIQQVLINLVRNAIEAMDGSPRREILIAARPTAAMVEIAVADSGHGIAPGHMEELFSQFMTTKSGGMGIGLPICRTIVEAHGGKIWAENRPEGGAVVRFTLPAARE